jgi:subtilase family serine protease
VAVGNGPDLVVTEVRTGSNVHVGGHVSVQVTLCNQGTAASTATGEVAVLQSTDSTITLQDFPIAAAPLPPLQPGQCGTLPVSGYTNGPEGAYVLGAIADPWAKLSELDESNNTRAGAWLGVGYGPDVTIQSLQGPASALPDAPLSAQLLVCNQGLSSSSPEDVALVLSTDATITLHDLRVGTASMPALSPGQCATVNVMGSTPGLEGAYVLGAIADPLGKMREPVEANNTFSGRSLLLGNKPDLTLTAVSGPAYVRPGASFSANVTVCNGGPRASLSAPLDVFRSSGSGEVRLGGGSVPGLDAGQCLTVPVSVTAPNAEGSYVLSAMVDGASNQAELREDNNMLADGVVTVSLNPDLTVTQLTANMANVVPNGSFVATVQVCNVGAFGSPSSRVQLFLSADTRIARGEDAQVADVPVSSMGPGTCRSQDVTVRATVPQGTWVLGALVDPLNSLPEANETNNALAGTPVGVGFGPDLTIGKVTTPPTVTPGSSFPATVEVCNRGTANQSTSTKVELFLSSDATFSWEDPVVGSATVLLPPAGACTSLQIYAFVPMGTGNWFVGAIADSPKAVTELREDNNVLVGEQVTVGTGPDLYLSDMKFFPSTSALRPGATFYADVTVCNRGNQTSPSSTVAIFFSSDANITVTDLEQGRTGVQSLMPGQCQIHTVPCTAKGQDGLYTQGAIVDPAASLFEVREDNNVRVGTTRQMDSTPPPTPSLTSTSPNVRGNTLNPYASGFAEPGVSVHLFTNSTCTGNSVGSGTASSTSGSYNAYATVQANTLTTLYAMAVDPAGNKSGCSAGRGYTHDGIAPAVPVLTATNPVSPGTTTQPGFQGSTDPGSTVKLYTTSTCTGTVAASGTADATGAFSLPVTVAADTTTTVYATATDAVGNVSACSAGLAYTHASVPPPAP